MDKRKIFKIILMFTILLIAGCKKGADSGLPEGNLPGNSYDELIQSQSWDCELTLSVIGSPSNWSEDGSVSWHHQIEIVSNFVGTFSSYPDGIYTPATKIWKLTSAWVYGKINNETFAVSGGDSVRNTLIGSKDFDIKDLIKNTWGYDSIILDLSSSTAYKIFIPEYKIGAYSTLYKVNEPGVIDEGPTLNQHSIPGTQLENIPYPAKGQMLSGSRTVKKMIFGASGDGMELDVNISWEFKPGPVIPSLDPEKRISKKRI